MRSPGRQQGGLDELSLYGATFCYCLVADAVALEKRLLLLFPPTMVKAKEGFKKYLKKKKKN